MIDLKKSFWKIQKIEKIFSQFNKSFVYQFSLVLLMRILNFGHQTYFSNLVILLSLKAKNDILILKLGSTEQTYFSPRQDLAICKLFNYFLTLSATFSDVLFMSSYIYIYIRTSIYIYIIYIYILYNVIYNI